VLSQLGLPDLGLFGPDLNAHLETPSLVKLGFTGINPWDRTRAAKLADGTWRYQYEDVTTATNILMAKLEAVRSWVEAPYHRFPLMDANTRHIGCSASQRTVGNSICSAQVLEMAATWKDTTKRITVYPANGQTKVPTSFKMTGVMLAAKSPLAPRPPITSASPASSRPPRAASGSGSRPAPGRLSPPDALTRILSGGGHRKAAPSGLVPSRRCRDR
jgi:hypothetical protein